MWSNLWRYRRKFFMTFFDIARNEFYGANEYVGMFIINGFRSNHYKPFARSNSIHCSMSATRLIEYLNNCCFLDIVIKSFVLSVHAIFPLLSEHSYDCILCTMFMCTNMYTFKNETNLLTANRFETTDCCCCCPCVWS